MRAARGPLLLALAGALLASAMAPTGIALATGLLVGSLLDVPRDDVLAACVVPLTAFAAVVFVGRSARSVADTLRHLAVQRIDGTHRSALIRLAAGTRSIDVLERPRVQKLLRIAQADRQSRVERTPGLGATAQLDLLIRFLGAAASCTLLAGYAWWLVPALLGPALASRAFARHQCVRHIAVQQKGVMEGIRADHWSRLATEWTGGKEVRTFGLADWAVDRSRAHALAMFRPRWAAEARNNREQWITAVIIGPPLATAYLLVVSSAARGDFPVAGLTTVLMAGWALLQTLVPTDVFDVEGGLVGLRAYERLRAELSADCDKAPDSLPVGPGSPLVRFERVSFTYPGTERQILKELDLEIRPGELLAIVGFNGAGKSTLIKLLSGLYRPTSGRITADGTDIARVAAAEWHRQLSVVFQDFVRYRFSAAENVSLGRAGRPADRATVEAAAGEAGLREVLSRLPHGWDTPLSRSCAGGVDLSGGQWQQVVLARALYAVRSGARVLVLDEPTAHLDVRTEFEVFKRLAAHRDDASVVLISHRLSTVRQADRIVLLDGGRVTECGTHDELMALGGTYADLFLTQASRFREGFDQLIQEGEVR
ncbi:ABC transporter ATP-binding protein [Streptomyces sp. NPDC057963]|uniref:ABC transporter ATP-binding protein n=1 Tax=Streptomyces sp. NPDC057963 TaxID=3346290 RepID=UPI0036E9F2EC